MTPVTVIGEIIAEGVGATTLVDSRGKPFSLPGTGWDHFREASVRKTAE